jgi:pimeloyl-ACP methyl ester carboxylesterase
MYILALIAGMAAATVATGFLYQWLGARRDRRLYTASGRWVSIGRGANLYLLEKGSGGATVIFESGIAATNLNWCHIQESVSKFTHTVSYDRGGLGWSSPERTPRTPGNIAVELHAMLEAAGIAPPYILVGHSFGGLVMRRYAALYPEDVSGLVLVDPMRPEEWPPLDPAKQAVLDRGVRLSGYALPIARLGLARLAIMSLLCRSGRLSTLLAGAAGKGGQHVLGRIKGEVGKMPREVWPIVGAHWSRPSFYAGMASHVRAVPDTVREMQNADPIAEIPILLLTPATSVPINDAGLSAIGDNVRQIIAPASAHWIHLDEPDLVIDAIRDLMQTSVERTVSV